MADSQDTVTIRAEMISDIPEQAAKSAAAIKGMSADMKTSGDAATVSHTALGKAVDNVGAKTASAATGHSNLSKSMEKVNESGKKVRETFAGIGETISEHLTYPLQQLSYVLEGAAAGIVAFGLSTYSSLQQTNLQLTAFTGNATAGATAMKALMALRDPADLSTLTGSYETLVNSGASSSTALALTKALTGAGAVSGNSANALGTGSTALADILQTGGKITSSDLMSLQKVFPQVASILGKDTGTSAQSVLSGAAYGQSWQMPTNFLSQLESTPQARNGLSAYGNTFEGELGRAKTSIGDLLSVLEQPLGKALASAASSVDSWAGGVESRFSRLSGTLGTELSSGNTGAFGHTLATVLGDPKLAGGITMVTRDMEDMAHIFTGSVVPAVREVGEVATPALKALSDVLDVMAAHRTATEAVIVTIGGFVVMSKVAQAFQTGSAAIAAFQRVVEGKGLLSALTSLSRGLTGLKDAEEGVTAASRVAAGAGATGEAEGAAGTAGGAAEGAEGAGLLGTLGSLSGATTGGAAAAAALIGWSAYGLLDQGSNLGTAYVKAASPGGSGLPGVSSLPSNIGTDAKNLITIQGDMNVTIPGAGNPEKVANSVPKGINQQINANAARTSRRTGQGRR